MSKLRVDELESLSTGESILVDEIDSGVRADLASPYGAAMVGRGVVAVDSIADLLALPAEQRREDLRYLVKGYHAGSDAGGGVFYLDADRPVSDHNGGTVIAIEKEFPADWSDLPAVISWFTPPTSGSGCFVASKVDPSRVATAEFGVRGGVSHSQRPAYQAALDALGLLGGGVVSSGFDLINLDARAEDGVCLQVPNNVWIDNRGCELRIIPNNFGAYSIVRFSEAITDLAGIFGGKIIGDKHTHLGSSGEWGMGVDIRGASRVVVRDIEANQCWGDGIYIGDNGAAPAIKTGHVLLDNVVCDDNRRQGLSITNAVKVVITYGEFTNTSGTLPESGIDIEPNLGTEITEVEFGTVVCSGNAGFGFLTVAPHTPAKIGKITGQRIIANSNSRAGVSVETTDEFHCAHVYAEGNGGSGLDIATVGRSDIRLLDCRDNGNTSAIRSAAVNYRNEDGVHSVGRMSVQGGSPAGSALAVIGGMGAVFECDSITVNGVNHSSLYAVAFAAPPEGTTTVNVGGVYLSDLPNSGLNVDVGVVCSISRVTLDRLDTNGIGTRYGVRNASAQARFGSIYAADGSNLYHVLRNAGDRSIFSSVVASPAALNGPWAAINDTSTGSIVVAQILS